MPGVVKLSDARQKRFSDFAQEPKVLDGSRVTLESILGHEIQALAYRKGQSKFQDSKTGYYTAIQFSDKNGTRHIIFTSSTVLTRQCEEYSDQMPFWTVIRKVGRYFTMT
jgi:abortive infection bacteriophage resistance protein